MIALAALLLTAVPPLDVRVDGEGYLRFLKEGRTVYARSATLCVREGGLASLDGAVLVPRVPTKGTFDRISISLEGRVDAVRDGKPTVLGQIVLALFAEGTRFRETAGYLATTTKPRLADPGDGEAGVIRARSLGPAPAAATGAKPTEPRTHAGIRVRLRSEVDGALVRLRDVAEVDLPEAQAALAEKVDFGPSPVPGTERILSLSYVQARLRVAGLKTEEFALAVPEGARVTRRAEVVTADEIEKAAIDAVLSQYDVAAKLRAQPKPLPITVASGERALRADIGKVSDGAIEVAVTVEQEGKVRATRTFTLVAAVAPGVKANQPVTLRFIRAGAVIEAPGKTKAAAAIGESVNVLSENGAEHLGIVRSPTLVEVRL